MWVLLPPFLYPASSLFTRSLPLTFCDTIEEEKEMLAHVAPDLAPAVSLLFFVLQIFFLILISCQSKATDGKWRVKKAKGQRLSIICLCMSRDRIHFENIGRCYRSIIISSCLFWWMMTFKSSTFWWGMTYKKKIRMVHFFFFTNISLPKTCTEFDPWLC